jgi:hypothetical protein
LPFSVSVQVVRDTQLIKIGVESEDPGLAANAANTLAQIFIEDRTEKQAERFSNLRASIEAQIAQYFVNYDSLIPYPSPPPGVIIVGGEGYEPQVRCML